MEREALMSKPLISYLSTINDENRSGVWGEGHKSKAAEKPSWMWGGDKDCAGCSLTLAGDREEPKKWNFCGNLFAESQIFIQNPLKLLFKRI